MRLNSSWILPASILDALPITPSNNPMRCAPVKLDHALYRNGVQCWFALDGTFKTDGFWPWQGTNHSDTCRYCADLLRSTGRTDAACRCRVARNATCPLTNLPT